MRAGINCALANRQILAHLTRRVFAHFFPDATLDRCCSTSRTTPARRRSTRSPASDGGYSCTARARRAPSAPAIPSLPAAFAATGQPVFIGGSMGTTSAIMVGPAARPEHAFASSCHGAGRRMSRHQALRHWHGRHVVDELRQRGIIIKSPSMRGVAEEAPGAYKDSVAVVDCRTRSRPLAQGRDARADHLHQGLTCRREPHTTLLCRQAGASYCNG